MQSVYLDYASTTPIDPQVAKAMVSNLLDRSGFANPDSQHALGESNAELVAIARQQVADLIGATPHEIIFTSGATESNNLAIAGAARHRAHRGKHLVTMSVEHKAVLDVFLALGKREGFDVTRLDPQAGGSLNLESFVDALRPDTQLVSVMLVNNETGVIQDVAALGAACRERDILFHVDAAQAAGKVPVNLASLPVDLMSLTAHKFYGPKGVGALFIADRPGVGLEPLMHGGGQERRLRPGTLPVHQIIGLGAAASLAAQRMQDDLDRMRQLRDRLLAGLRAVSGLRLNGPEASGFPGIVNVSAEGVDGESLLLAMDPVCVARGSACNAASGEASYVLRALGLDDVLAGAAIRFSFGRFSSESDIDTAIDRYIDAVHRLRRIAPGQENS